MKAKHSDPELPSLSPSPSSQQPSHQPAPNSHPPETHPRTTRRNGKVAHLPKFERDIVNRMLSDGSTYASIVGALDEIGSAVTARNISSWALGGYKDWLADQERAAENRLRQDSIADLIRDDEATQLPEVGLQLAATRLSELLFARGTREASPEADLDKYLRIVSALCRLSREIFALQKYRDDCARSLGRDSNPEIIKRTNEREFESVIKAYGSKHSSSPEPEAEEAESVQPKPIA